MFFYLVTTGWIFNISLRENSINKKNITYFCVTVKIFLRRKEIFILKSRRTLEDTEKRKNNDSKIK